MKPLRILIVDDHRVNLKLLRVQLEADQHTVLEAMNGVEALAVLDRELIDCIISDILMPVMDGYRLCYEVRRDPRFSDIPFIIYTATYTSPSDEQLSVDLGADAYLRKPAPASSILRVIDEVFSRPRGRPKIELEMGDGVKAYSARLVNKLEQKNIELTAAMHQLTLETTALMTAEDAFVITDANGTILWVNPAFTKNTGYAPEEAIGKTPRILKSGMHGEAFYRGFWSTILSGRSWRGEFANRRKDGTIVHDEHTVTPIIGPDGKITNFVGVMHDVTQRRHAEQQLREAHTQLRQLLEHSPAVIYALRIEGETVVPHVVSENIKRLLGFEVSETLSLQWWQQQLHPGDRGVAEASIAETLTNGASRTEYRLRHKDGTYRWVDDTRTLVRDAGELVGVWNDITERKAAEDELHESDRRFREMLNHLGLVGMMVDRDGRFTYCNDFLLDLTGWTREEVLGRSCFDIFIPPEHEVVMRDAFARLLADDPAQWRNENEILTKSGNRRRIQFYNTVLRSASGEVIGAASIGEDITDRVIAERELRRSEGQLRIIVESSTDGAWDWDTATDEVTWSDRAYEMLGYERATFKPTMDAIRQRIHADDLSARERALQEHLDANAPYRVRFRFRHGSGKFIPILSRGQFQSESGRMVGLYTDLSVVEQAEERIHEQAALIEQAHDAIVVRDLDDRITFWSKGAERLYGWTAQEVADRRFAETLHVKPDAYATARSVVLTNGAWAGESERTASGGRVVVVDSSWTLLRDEQGQPRAIFSIDTNITERKALENQFYRAQRLESLGALASGVAHDLNNLLMPILMGANLLKRLNKDPGSLQAITNIERSVKRGTDLVKQVLLFARGAEGVRAPVTVNHVIDEVRSIAESTFPKNIAIVTQVPSTLSRLMADATQLNQVLVNLLVNARDAMPSGGQITIAATEVNIDQQTAIMNGGHTAGRYVVIEVADNGIGMPKAVLDRVFEPFFTTKDVTKGTGLGLSTALTIVERHGGFIKVTSEVGRGTTFRVHLPPYGDSGGAAVSELEAPAVPHGNGEVILVVDDEVAILNITKQTLEAFGYSALTAEDGAQAIGIFAREQTRIAAVVTDMMMPVLDGTALIAALRRIHADVPIVAVSGQPEGQRERAAGAGANDFLVKPYSAEVLLRTLWNVLHPSAG